MPPGRDGTGQDGLVRRRQPCGPASRPAAGRCAPSALAACTPVIRRPQHPHLLSGAYSKGHEEISSLSAANTLSTTGQSRCV